MLRNSRSRNDRLDDVSMMTPTHYDLLGVPSTASFDEIRRAFRREIAKYHPDKVLHLGHEFQDIAAVRSAELTRAYKTLTDEALRTDYDASVRSELVQRGTASPAPCGEPAVAPMPAVWPQGSVHSAQDSNSPSQPELATAAVRTGVSDLVRKAAVVRFRQALEAEFGFCEEAPVQGFEVVCAPSKARFWSKLPPRMYARFVRYVDGAAVSEGRTMVSRVAERDDERGRCLFLMGQYVAPAAELALAIARERRRPAFASLELTIVPVNTRTWSASVPNDAPAPVKSLMARLELS